MPALVDARPAGVDLLFRAGTTVTLTAEWQEVGALTGRTFTSTLNGQALDVTVVNDTLTVVASDAITTAITGGVEWLLLEDIDGTDEAIMTGRWAPSTRASATSQHTVQVVQGGATVEVNVQGIPTAVGDLTVTGDLVHHQPLIFWQHPVNQTLATGTWTPIAFNTLTSTVGNWTTYVAASTTIAAGSDTAVLPQSTIHVASTTGFASRGYLVVRISGTDRVIQYTGKTATSFTGCTFGVGTLSTGQAIAQANVEFNVPGATLGPLVAELAWASSATGLRGTRCRFTPDVFPLNGATDVRAAGVASSDPAVRTIVVEQPSNAATDLMRIEGFQSSGGNLDTVVDQLAAPRVVATVTTSYEA